MPCEKRFRRTAKLPRKATRSLHACLRYAALPPPLSRSFGHGLQGLRGLEVAGAGKSDETGRSECGLFDRRLGIFLEVAEQPASREPRMTARIFAGDEQRQFERVDETELRKFAPAATAVIAFRR